MFQMGWNHQLVFYHLLIWVIYWFCRAIWGNILGTTARVPCQVYPNFPFDYGTILGKSGVAFLRKKSGRGGREAEEDRRREEGVARGELSGIKKSYTLED